MKKLSMISMRKMETDKGFEPSLTMYPKSGNFSLLRKGIEFQRRGFSCITLRAAGQGILFPFDGILFEKMHNHIRPNRIFVAAWFKCLQFDIHIHISVNKKTMK